MDYRTRTLDVTLWTLSRPHEPFERSIAGLERWTYTGHGLPALSHMIRLSDVDVAGYSFACQRVWSRHRASMYDTRDY